MKINSRIVCCGIDTREKTMIVDKIIKNFEDKVFDVVESDASEVSDDCKDFRIKLFIDEQIIALKNRQNRISKMLFDEPHLATKYNVNDNFLFVNKGETREINRNFYEYNRNITWIQICHYPMTISPQYRHEIQYVFLFPDCILDHLNAKLYYDNYVAGGVFPTYELFYEIYRNISVGTHAKRCIVIDRTITRAPWYQRVFWF